jgi:enoyl-CoA hydratase/carnithine racemase
MPDRKSVMFMLQIPKPIIAAINGACAGIGFVIASMCDIRFASSDAKMTTSFAQRGLVAEQGLSWMLPRIVGLANSLDLLFSARVFRGEEAERLGFVSRVVNSPDNVVQVAYDYARELAMSCSPSSLASIKRQLYGDYLRTASSALASADIAMKASLAHPDFQEGAKSFLEGRPAEYEAIATAPDSEFADNELDHLLPPNLID